MQFNSFTIQFYGSYFLQSKLKKHTFFTLFLEETLPETGWTKQFGGGYTYEIDTNCADITFCICIVSKSQQKAWFSHTRIADQKQFEEIITKKREDKFDKKLVKKLHTNKYTYIHIWNMYVYNMTLTLNEDYMEKFMLIFICAMKHGKSWINSHYSYSYVRIVYNFSVCLQTTSLWVNIHTLSSWRRDKKT